MLPFSLFPKRQLLRSQQLPQHSLQRTPIFDLASKTVWAFPLHDIDHWMVGCVDFEAQTISFMDPLGDPKGWRVAWAFSVSIPLAVPHDPIMTSSIFGSSRMPSITYAIPSTFLLSTLYPGPSKSFNPRSLNPTRTIVASTRYNRSSRFVPGLLLASSMSLTLTKSAKQFCIHCFVNPAERSTFSMVA